jgi:hypothetical protein
MSHDSQQLSSGAFTVRDVVETPGLIGPEQIQ